MDRGSTDTPNKTIEPEPPAELCWASYQEDGEKKHAPPEENDPIYARPSSFQGFCTRLLGG
jgi:hypothetical protein